MASSLLRMKVAAASAIVRFGSHGFGLGSDLGVQAVCRRGYSVAAAKIEFSAGLIRSDPKDADDRAAAGYRQTSWMPDPVTGYYIPEDHFGESDIAELRENILKNHSATSRGGPN
uniref:Late embryogenesis abundant protein Lea5 n=1 Tax=Picea sitchensis TaxID=3332 RepID=A9NZM8_PICSI|nr:unknown [Picea sitchensis]